MVLSILQVPTIGFDINFLNFEDPVVLERLTGPHYKHQWQSSYGFDFVTKDEGEVKILGKFPQHCVQSEFR